MKTYFREVQWTQQGISGGCRVYDEEKETAIVVWSYFSPVDKNSAQCDFVVPMNDGSNSSSRVCQMSRNTSNTRKRAQIFSGKHPIQQPEQFCHYQSHFLFSSIYIEGPCDCFLCIYFLFIETITNQTVFFKNLNIAISTPKNSNYRIEFQNYTTAHHYCADARRPRWRAERDRLRAPWIRFHLLPNTQYVFLCHS